jgi:hypothetical protein
MDGTIVEEEVWRKRCEEVIFLKKIREKKIKIVELVQSQMEHRFAVDKNRSRCPEKLSEENRRKDVRQMIKAGLEKLTD